MRLIYDLYPCQTGSRFRGIGRFTHSMAEMMARLRDEHEMYLLANGLFRESAEDLRKKLSPRLQPGRFSTYTYPDQASLGCDSVTHAKVATALVQHAYQALAPDAVIYTTPFEGWGEQGVVPLPGGNIPTALRIAVLYDFIPWLFPDQYLDSVPGYRAWYERRLAALHEFDLLLAISEATRSDAIEILKIPPERVVNISGAAGTQFRPMTSAEKTKHNISRFGILRPFVLYTGNADYRKNLDGMLQAYARLPLELRNAHQLVLNQVGDDLHAFRRKVHSLGLTDQEVVVTGHITDDELICLYTQCKLFVFPSLYEGFGLPILEAMACGAPVIAANNSSIPEVVGRNDVLFDASDPAAIANALQHVLTDENLRSELVDYSIERAKFFSWERTAKLAWQAIEESLAFKRAVSPQHSPQPVSKPRIAMVCPLSSQDALSTLHCVTLLPSLVRHFEIDLFVEEGTQANAPLLHADVAIYPHTQLTSRRDRYATVVYQVANSPCHAYMLPLMEQYAGIVVLHDVHLEMPLNTLAQHPGTASALENEIIYSHGLQGLIDYFKQSEQGRPLLMHRRVVESAQYLILTDPAHAGLLRQANINAWLPPSVTLPSADQASCVAAYTQAIHAAIAGDQTFTIKQLADALEDSTPDESVLNTIASHASHNWRLRGQARILIDVTQLAKTDANSGIQRVVKKISCEIGNMTPAQSDRPIDLVHMDNGKLWRASTVIGSIFEVDPKKIPEEEVRIQPGDTLLMIDSSWEQYGEFLSIFQNVRLLGGKIVTVVYDLIPLRLPQMCLPALVEVFRRWFHLAAEQSDMLVCISRSVADDAVAYLTEQNFDLEMRPAISHWHLGADIGTGNREIKIRPQVNQIAADKQSSLFLMVGTIEPRKGHDFVLDAFESLWQGGADIRLCIAGNEGWHVAETMQRIRKHPQLNKKLFLIEKFTDAEINLCYSAATALIAASTAEGFGLPIVEAALHKVPVLASDIPVFREVGGEGAQYFSLAHPQHLTNAIKALSHLSAEDRSVMASKIRTLTWRESAKELLAATRAEAPGIESLAVESGACKQQNANHD